MTIIETRERDPDELGFSVTHVGGKSDGLEFRMVLVTMNDGSTRWLFASNSHTGFFKQVFVPWDFKHAKIIDLA